MEASCLLLLPKEGCAAAAALGDCLGCQEGGAGVNTSCVLYAVAWAGNKVISASVPLPASQAGVTD